MFIFKLQPKQGFHGRTFDVDPECFPRDITKDDLLDHALAYLASTRPDEFNVAMLQEYTVEVTRVAPEPDGWLPEALLWLQQRRRDVLGGAEERKQLPRQEPVPKKQPGEPPKSQRQPKK